MVKSEFALHSMHCNVLVHKPSLDHEAIGYGLDLGWDDVFLLRHEVVGYPLALNGALFNCTQPVVIRGE